MEVQITSFYFRNTQNGFNSFPRQMVLEGQEYNFSDLNMSFLVRKGQQLIRLFDMTDGQNDYRLRQEGNSWSLIDSKMAA